MIFDAFPRRRLSAFLQYFAEKLTLRDYSAPPATLPRSKLSNATGSAAVPIHTLSLEDAYSIAVRLNAPLSF
jgi:hypothetical protein